MKMLSKIMMMGALFSIASCHGDEDRIVMVQSAGLDADNLGFHSLWVKDQDNAVIAGSSDKVTHNQDKKSDQFAFVTKTALLYRTVDGGKTWIKSEFGQGSFLNIIQAGRKIIAMKVIDEPKRYIVYSSEDWGATWKEDPSFPTGIHKLFASDGGYWAVTLDNGDVRTHLSISRDSGRSWEVHDPPYIVLDAIKRDDKLVYLSWDSAAADWSRKNLLVEYDPRSDKWKATPLPAEFDCYFLNEFDKQLILTGIEDKHLAVYSADEESGIRLKYAYDAESGFFPKGYFADGGKECLIVGKRGADDVSGVLLETADNGKNWQKIPFEHPKHVEPYSFFTDGDKAGCWFFSGLGRFQKIEWKR